MAVIQGGAGEQRGTAAGERGGRRRRPWATDLLHGCLAVKFEHPLDSVEHVQISLRHKTARWRSGLCLPTRTAGSGIGERGGGGGEQARLVGAVACGPEGAQGHRALLQLQAVQLELAQRRPQSDVHLRLQCGAGRDCRASMVG